MDTGEGTIWKNPSKSLVYSWIADYIFQETWEEFCADYSVDSETDRKLISGIVQKVGNSSKNPEFILKSSLLIFISFLSDAKDDLKDRNGDFEETILERALTILESNLQVEQFEKDLRQLAVALRLQAVLCCCRRNEWTLAEEVSQRIWPEGNEERSAEKEIVAHILNSKQQKKNLERFLSYPNFLEKTKNILAKVVAQFSVPFLHTCQKNIQQMKLPDSQETDGYSEYQSAEEGDDSLLSQVEHNDPSISQENDSVKSKTVADGNNNQNNATQESVMLALDLHPQKKTTQAENVEATEDGDNEEDDLEVEVSQIEIRERELRSRTVPGFVKQTMTIKAPKKSANVEKMELQEKDESEDVEETQIDNEMEDGDVADNSGDKVTEIPESEDEADKREAGSGRGKRKNRRREKETESKRTGEDDTRETSENPPVSLAILKQSFRKLGHGSQFWKGIEEDLGSLHENLVNLPEQEVSDDEKSSSQEEEEQDLEARKTSTPVTNSFLRPMTYPPLVQSKLGRMKHLQTRPTKSTNEIFPSAKDSSKDEDQAGPSSASTGYPSDRQSKRKRFRELESRKEEEDGERVIWNSDDDDSMDSEDSIGSLISKASLKSPKIRKSLEGTSVDIRRPWSEDEVRKLIKGVRRFGVGKWSEIKDHYDFDRTNVNLKDKWRNLVKKFGTSSPSKMCRE